MIFGVLVGFLMGFSQDFTIFWSSFRGISLDFFGGRFSQILGRDPGISGFLR